MPHASSSILSLVFTRLFTRRAPVLFGAFALTAIGALGALTGGCSSIVAEGSIDAKGGTAQLASGDDASVAADAGTQPSFGADASNTVASPYTGSPLCHATPNTCFPDTTLAGSATDADADATGSSVGVSCTNPSSATSDTGVTDACRVRSVKPNDPTPACALSGTGTDDAKCYTGSDCAPGYDCTSDGVCRRYCCSGECDGTSGGSPTFCDIVSLKDEQTLVPACVPVVNCALLADSCPAKETCSIVKDDGTTSCVAAGNAAAGESCDEAHCAQDLVCLGQPGTRQCFALCHIANATCPSGTVCKASALVANDTTVGICETPQM